MKKIIYPVLALSILLTSATLSLTSQEYKIKDGHSIAFKSKDPSGSFKEINGTINFDENDLGNSKFDLTIDVSSINTGNGMMQKKAQTSEWFDAAKYPTIKFVSTSIEKSGSDYMIIGKLTMKGVTKDKKIPAKLSKSGNDLTFSGSFPVNRIEHKVGKKSDAVPDIMNITYSLPVTKK
jgi:polyisoprenoid-binding protein YceI